MPLSICLSGATGHVGREIVSAITDRPEFKLCACIGKTSAGRRLPDVLAFPCPDIEIAASVRELSDTGTIDVLIDYTAPDAVFQTVCDAIDRNIHCVIGTSGLSDEDYADIDRRAGDKGVGVFAAGNFSITAALLLHFSKIAARFVPTWEILDFAPDTKPDAPSGTARELASLLSDVGSPEFAVAPRNVTGLPEARGATLRGSQVHSVRVPGYYSSAEAIFGLAGEKITLRHDSISYTPYVHGTLLAAGRVSSFTGLVRGMDRLLDFTTT